MSRILYILLCAFAAHGVHHRRQSYFQYHRIQEAHEAEEAEEAEVIDITEHDLAVAVVPAPSLVYRTPGSITLPSQVLVKAPAKMLQAFRKHAYEAVSPIAKDETPHVLLQLTDTQDKHGDEGYTLQVRKDGVTMKASSEHGLFNGIMTFRQLANKTGPSSRLSLPLVYIEDKPAFPWRGMMLDVSRHFFPPDDVKHLLDTMAFFKMNHFHWHLTDDQGWRFPVEKYPKLTTVGSMRRETQKGHDQYRTDREEYNHSYTRDDIDDILQHAESLFIEVMPECDMPGHLESAIAAYPQLGNSDITDYHPQVEPHFGAFDYTLSPKKQSTQFQNSVLSELVLLFQNSDYIHLGGDEVKPNQWEVSADARAISFSEDTDADHLEATFIQHAAEHLAKHDRHAVIWDEALSTPNLPDSTVVMLWRDWGNGLEDIGDRAASKNLPVVLAPHTWTYLDQFQSAHSSSEPYDANGGLLPLNKVYDMPLRAGQAKVLGMQAQLWSEYISKGRQNMDYMAWPRGAALAEVAWAGSARPGFDDFEKRLTQQLESLDHMEVHYRKLDKDSVPAYFLHKRDHKRLSLSELEGHGPPRMSVRQRHLEQIRADEQRRQAEKARFAQVAQRAQEARLKKQGMPSSRKPADKKVAPNAELARSSDAGQLKKQGMPSIMKAADKQVAANAGLARSSDAGQRVQAASKKVADKQVAANAGLARSSDAGQRVREASKKAADKQVAAHAELAKYSEAGQRAEEARRAQEAGRKSARRALEAGPKADKILSPTAGLFRSDDGQKPFAAQHMAARHVVLDD